MPLYDCRHRELVSGIPDDPPMRNSLPFPADWNGTVDADGKLLSPLLWCDTESGDVGRYDRTDGNYEIDSNTRRLRILYERHPAPLRAATLQDIAAPVQQARLQCLSDSQRE